MRGQMKNFKYLMQSLVQQVGAWVQQVGGLGWLQSLVQPGGSLGAAGWDTRARLLRQPSRTALVRCSLAREAAGMAVQCSALAPLWAATPVSHRLLHLLTLPSLAPARPPSCLPRRWVTPSSGSWRS